MIWRLTAETVEIVESGHHGRVELGHLIILKIWYSGGWYLILYPFLRSQECPGLWPFYAFTFLP